MQLKMRTIRSIVLVATGVATGLLIGAERPVGKETSSAIPKTATIIPAPREMRVTGGEYWAKKPPKKYPRYKNHWAEFLQAVQQKRAANTPFEQCGKYTIMGLMGTVATRFPGRRLEFDSASMRFTNMPEANALLRPEWTDAALSEWGSYL